MKYKRRLGESPEADFVSGQNNLLMYLTWGLVFIIVLWTIGNLPTILKMIENGKKNQNPNPNPNPNNASITPNGGGGSTITPNNPVVPNEPTGIQEVPQPDNVRTLQWLLKTAGYYTNTVDGQWGSGSNSAMRRFEDENGISRRFIVGNYTDPIGSAIPEVRRILRQKGVLKGLFAR